MKEARNIMFPNGKCGCATERVEYTDYIEFCPLHAAAPDMYEALQLILDAYEKWNNREDGGEDDLHYAARKVNAVLYKANGK